MSIPQPYLQHHQKQPEDEHPQHTLYRNFVSFDNQNPPNFVYTNPSYIPDQSHTPPYTSPFHVLGLAPTPAPAVDNLASGGNDLQLDFYNYEPVKKKLKEQDFMENNSHMSSIDFLQVQPVSTGLGLSLDNNRIPSSVEPPLLGLIGDDINRELRQQDAEIDRFLKVQSERIRHAVLEKVQATQIQTISLIEEKMNSKIREREAEVESMSRKNSELEEHIGKLSMEAGAWRQRASYNENIIASLKTNLQQLYERQSRDSREGCGDSEVDDTASCCKGGFGDSPATRGEAMVCRLCGTKEARMLLLPCKHLCLCKGCEPRVNCCPLCRSSKAIALEIFI